MVLNGITHLIHRVLFVLLTGITRERASTEDSCCWEVARVVPASLIPSTPSGCVDRRGSLRSFKASQACETVADLYLILLVIIQLSPRLIAKLVNITSITKVYDACIITTDIYISYRIG